jgi:hypothetical protein
MSDAPDCEPPSSSKPAYLGIGGLEALYDNVQVQLPGVTTDNVVMQAWNVINDFYLRSTYRREHVYWEMAPGVTSINFNPWDSHWLVFRFLALRGLSDPKVEPPGKLRDIQFPTPTNVRHGEALLALVPKDLNTPLGDDFWMLWFDTIVSGVLGRLYLQPGKPYTDGQMGRIQLGMYRTGVNQARAHVQSYFVTDGVPWLFPYFAAGRPKTGGWGW